MRLQLTIPFCILAGTAAEDADILLQLRPQCGSCPPTSVPPTSVPPTSVPPTTVPVGEVGWCDVFGDPHIKTFDRDTSDIHFYNYGDYWLVKRSDIWVQARYWSTRQDGRSAVRSLAISQPPKPWYHPSGPQEGRGAALIIDSSGEVADKPSHWEGVFPWDPSPFTHKIVPCADLPNRGKEGGFFTGSQAEWTQKCEDRIQQFPHLCDDEWAFKVHCKNSCGFCEENNEERHVISLSSAPNVSITVVVLNHGGSFLNVHLEMPHLDEEQSGHCGNFNGDATDDEPSSAMVDNKELLLPARQWDVVVPPVPVCSDALKEEAQIHCEAIIGNGKVDQVDACVIDYCGVGKEAADATVSATVS